MNARPSLSPKFKTNCPFKPGTGLRPGLRLGLRLVSDFMIILFDYEREAEERIPPAHWGYIAGGANDEVTVGANRTAFDRILIRYRTMVDVSTRDLHASVLGVPVSMPVLVAPTAMQRLAHNE